MNISSLVYVALLVACLSLAEQDRSDEERLVKDFLRQALEGLSTSENEVSSTTPEVTSTVETTTSTTTSISTEQTTTRSRPRPRLKPNREISKKCSRIGTGRFREYCRRISKNPISNEIGEIFAFASTGDELSSYFNTSSYFWRQMTSQRRELTIGVPKTGLHCGENHECPSASEWKSSEKNNLRSFSPWKTCYDYDPDRFPQWIPIAQCLCHGCINPLTGEEDNNYVSLPLKTYFGVFRKQQSISFSECTTKTCYDSVLEINVGCHCALPSESTD